MKVLMISTDRKLFEKGSNVYKRSVEYGRLADELHIIVFSFKKPEYPKNKFQVARNVWVYPTNSYSKVFYITDAIRIGRKILRDKIDIITTQNVFETGIVGWVLSRKTNIKFHMQIHTDILSPYYYRGVFMNKIRVIMSKILIKYADSVRVVSNRIKNSLQEFVSKSISITVLPIFAKMDEIENFEAKYDLHDLYPQFDTIILMISRLEPEKNIQMGIDAMGKVLEKYPKTGLVIAGSGSERGKLEKRIVRNNLQSNVVFTGWLDEVFSGFKTADVFSLTSDYEGYAMTLVEAAVSGTPIVTTNVGLVGDILKNNEDVLVCDPHDTKCIVEKLIKIIGDAQLRNRLSKHAKDSIKKYVLQDEEEYLTVYKEAWKI